ncbi:hypothetical protein [Microbulbifer rhizosphaerae]|uniref:Lipoprotein n=1 Tax=Microbulbifer rhizosphaerae TaxID=1562603 RepID=A0A7W4ZB45_9GAMM|nr:hypothetical protein [Microbulbifer rhizosphaerae]MBB3063236.1 hypothetical protein [Microbulbifer rhizosphaerae]
MRFDGLAAILGVLALLSASGCGHLPSELAPPKKKESETQKETVTQKAAAHANHARVAAQRHTVSCDTPARDFRKIRFDDLYITTGDPDKPFRVSEKAPAQYDIAAYVWGYDNCVQAGTCKGGDHYWLIGRGPGNDFRTWVTTPQYPRITVQSECRQRLKVGEKYRFSFSRGKLVGFSR